MHEREIISKILLVEDDLNLGFVIRDNLEHKGYEVILCRDGEEGFRVFSQNTFDLCLLDIMLPKQDGFRLAEQIRERDQDIPLIFLTAKSMKEDKISGFNIGADDYITKPFNIDELLLRIRVFLRRSGKKNEVAVTAIKLGSYTFNHAHQELIDAHNNLKKLTRKEADLLKVLCDNMGRMVKREELLKKVWDTDDYFAGRSMDVFISRLRKTLAADKGIEIVNYHGTGFKLVSR